MRGRKNPARQRTGTRGWTWQSIEQYASATGAGWPSGTVAAVNDIICGISASLSLMSVHLATPETQQMNLRLQPFLSASQRLPSSRGAVGQLANMLNGMVITMYRFSTSPEQFMQWWQGLGAALLNMTLNVEDQLTAAYVSQVQNTLQAATLAQVGTSFGALSMIGAGSAGPGTAAFPLQMQLPTGPGTGNAAGNTGSFQPFGFGNRNPGVPGVPGTAAPGLDPAPQTVPANYTTYGGQQAPGVGGESINAAANTVGGLASVVGGAYGGQAGATGGAMVGQGIGQFGNIINRNV